MLQRLLVVPSGRIIIAGCTDYLPDAARITVQPGTYKVRIYYGALDSVDEEWGWMVMTTTE